MITKEYEEMVSRSKELYANLSDEEKENNKELYAQFLEGDAAFRKLAEMGEKKGAAKAAPTLEQLITKVLGGEVLTPAGMFQFTKALADRMMSEWDMGYEDALSTADSITETLIDVLVERLDSDFVNEITSRL